MVLPRRPISSWTPLLRQRSSAATRSSTFRQSWHQIKARGYATEHGHAASKGGDLQWGLIATAVTIPTLYWIGLHKPQEHGHDDHHEEKEESEDGKEEESGDEEESKDESSDDGGDKKDQGEEKDEGGKKDDSEADSDSDSDDKQDTPDTSDDEGDKSEGGDDDDSKNNAVKYKDAKGGVKNRKESKKGQKQGEPDDEDDTSGDKGKSAKPAAGGSSSGSTSGKQEGLSNTDTKHSTNITENQDKSRKPEGGPDTAKAKGSVSPNRPQAEDKKSE